jgi:hypothetical protein
MLSVAEKRGGNARARSATFSQPSANSKTGRSPVDHNIDARDLAS